MSNNELRDVFKEANLLQWSQKLNALFSDDVPVDYVWTGRGAIVAVLQQLGDKDLDHLFLPTGGGLDLSGASQSNEAGAIELHLEDESVHLIKPAQLLFHSFGPDLQWAYFRLETKPLGSMDIGSINEFREVVAEMTPGRYENVTIFHADSYGYDESGNPLPFPDTTRLINRYFKGSFVLFAKGSVYNGVPDTYDARHDKMDDAGFKAYIGRAVEELNARTS